MDILLLLFRSFRLMSVECHDETFQFMGVNSSNGLEIGDFSFIRINTYFSVLFIYDDLVLNFHLLLVD